MSGHKVTAFAHSTLFLGLLHAASAGAYLDDAFDTASLWQDEDRPTWRSGLYPTEWQPSTTARFDQDKLIQDFSYAGYHAGAEELPMIRGPLFDVSQEPFRADISGGRDATSAIQAAIKAAETAGGGVVYLPEGTYKVTVAETNTEALLIRQNGIVIRGDGSNKTFIRNDTTQMRGKVVVRIASEGGRGDLFNKLSNETRITKDLMHPTRMIPVYSVEGFNIGDYITIDHELTDAWVEEHGEVSWKLSKRRPRSPTYIRQIISIDENEKILEIDVPTRYYLKTRDRSRVQKLFAPPLSEVGIEHLAIGNRQHASTQWGDSDHSKSGTGAYDVKGSYFISFERARDCWARNIKSFAPAENTSQAHLLSNGILISQCSRITLADIDFQNVQYGGAGGNGYLYRLQYANDCLLVRCRASFSRHGFVFSHAGSNGNVLHRCSDELTGRATGHTGNYKTTGRGSDHHMHFSHSNLIDHSIAYDSWFEARYRPYPSSSVIKHGITAAHTVFWNIQGLGRMQEPVIISEQAQYGYVIGTSGTRASVELPTRAPHATNPADHVEGVGMGDMLEPQSLYLDQLKKRVGHTRQLSHAR